MILDIGIKAEGLGRAFLKDIEKQLRKHSIKDINPVQAVMLFKLASLDIRPINVSELQRYGIYLGTNPSYNLKALVENGYVSYSYQACDHRMRLLAPTSKGLYLYNDIYPIFNIKTAVVEDFYDWLCGMEKFMNQWRLTCE